MRMQNDDRRPQFLYFADNVGIRFGAVLIAVIQDRRTGVAGELRQTEIIARQCF